MAGKKGGSTAPKKKVKAPMQTQTRIYKRLVNQNSAEPGKASKRRTTKARARGQY
jgi:hypothetical protein